VKLADLLFVEGIKSGSSDVHVEPTMDGVIVRYRIDGILEESFHFPKWLQQPLVARLKVMARMDIAERRVPQDGRIQVRYQNRTIDLRVSTLPMQHGEKVTMRILDATRALIGLERLGLSPQDQQRLRDAASKPQGLILVTGPTGSGKTTTLYALIRAIRSGTTNIITIENPVEYQLKGINQVDINEKQGLTFASVLRSVLRQDPYGKGWLLSMHVPDEENTGRNLVPKRLVSEWMRDAVDRLYSAQPALAGAVAADGGRPADDVFAGLPDANWKEMTGEFFLTV